VIDLEAQVTKAVDARIGAITGNVDRYGQWVKWLVYGAFALGVWVATIQLAIDQTRADVKRLDAHAQESRNEIQSLREDVAVIKATVLEMKEAVKELRTDLKERQ
jgi:hypothetical protein